MILIFYAKIYIQTKMMLKYVTKNDFSSNLLSIAHRVMPNNIFIFRERETEGLKQDEKNHNIKYMILKI